jgi:hypothetical protein
MKTKDLKRKQKTRPGGSLEPIVGRWEYLVGGLWNPTPEQEQGELNKHGADGWELVTVMRRSNDYVMYYLRRSNI